MEQVQTRFKNSDFSAAIVEPWSPHHQEYIQGFRCIRPHFASDFKKRVTRDVESHLSKCWVITEEKKLVGFITLLADRTQIMDEKGEPRKILIEEGVKYRTYPAIKIGLLAADKRAKRAGFRLVEWAVEYIAGKIASSIGARFITVDAYYDRDTGYDVSTYYQKNFGFEYSNPNEALPPEQPYRTMFLDLKPIIEAIRDEAVNT